MTDISTTSSQLPNWRVILKPYAKSDRTRAIWQLVNSLGPYVFLWALMAWSMRVGLPYWATLLVAPLAACFLVRIFIIFHDCGHGSFFASRRANAVWGFVCALLVFTPSEAWSHAHALHHGSVGDLDRRGMGDVWTMTVEEYRTAPWYLRLSYRVMREPIILFGVGGMLSFLVFQRFPDKTSRRKEILSIVVTDIALAVLVVGLGLLLGFRTYLLVQLPIMWLATIMGLWLFYVQHQYQSVYWARHEQWDRTRASLEGSSFYDLPRVLRWFSGNIGFHHIHHLRSRIPNYRLAQAQAEVEALQSIPRLSLRQSLASLRMGLYDEKRERMVSFREARLS